MAKFVTAGIYSGLLNALMEAGAARLEEFELTDPREGDAETSDLILSEQEGEAGDGEVPAPLLGKSEEEERSRRE